MPRRTIIFTSLGTRGDAIPFVDLAVEMQRRGHRTAFLSNADHRPLADNAGIAFDDICEPEMPQVGCDPRAFAAEQLIPASYRLARHIGALVAAEDDLFVVSRFGTWGATAACEKHGIPFANLLLQPDAIWEDGNPIHPEDLVLLNRFRAELGLPAVHGSGVLEPAVAKISLFPDWFGYPESRSWAAGRCAGFPLRPLADTKLPQDVEAFIEAHGAPIVFALGSGMTEVARFLEIARALPGRTGRPVLFLSLAAGAMREDTDERFRAIDYLDHGLLFPRSAMVVHNGGIGVTAQAIRAGIPQLAVPFVWDQPDNAARLCALGIGRTVEPAALSVDSIVGAVRELDAIDPKLLMMAKAGVRGDAIARAADRIERCWSMPAEASAREGRAGDRAR